MPDQNVGPGTAGTGVPSQDTGLIGGYWHPLQTLDTSKVNVQQKRSDVWKPTGKGFHVNPLLANFVANGKNASKLELVNTKYVKQGSNESGDYTKPDEKTTDTRYVWADNIAVGWSLNYTSGQSKFGKSFYPHDVSYGSCVISGQTKSQHDYDQLVEWVIKSQKAALFDAANVVKYTMTGRTTLVRRNVNLARFDSMVFRGYIKNIKAGHKKGEFSPRFQLEFLLVSYGKNDFTITNGTDNYLYDMGNLTGTTATYVNSLSTKFKDNQTAQDTGYIDLNSNLDAMVGEEGFYPQAVQNLIDPYPNA